MSLSICCATANPSRAATALSTLREMADEIVVAVDVSGGEQDLSPLRALADRLFEIELDAFPEPAMAWLHAQCSAEWILRLDDDEVPSARLLDELPELTEARDVVQYWLARRWLYPDAGHWLAQWPWFPDFQGRLVRNDARLWFPGMCHSSVAFTSPARYLDGGIYHLAHLLCSRAERERKVERYLAVDPALRETGADAHLPTYYVPERTPDAELAAIDPRDRDIIGAFFDRLARAGKTIPNQRPLHGAGLAQRVPRSEVQARWAARTLEDTAYRAQILPVDVHRQLVADDHRPFRVNVRNEGTEWWPGGGEERLPLIRLAYQWLTPQGVLVEGEGHRTALPHPLAPGESCLVAMNVTAPPVAGRYMLAPDLVHEHVRWFQCESTPLEMLVSAPGNYSP
ncbi:MAG TPA: hypothetical protein VGI24_07850 [Solirubrobacteraceae bacterium]